MFNIDKSIFKSKLPLALYLRKSKGKNGETKEETLSSHLNTLVNFCNENNLEYELYNDYIAKSTNLDREEYRKMLNACLTGKHDVILVMEESRLYRTVFEQTNVYEDLKETGIVIVSLREGVINPSDRNQFLVNIIRGAMNQQELENFAYRMNLRKFESSKSKYVNKVPYGYLKDKDSLIPHPEESKGFRLAVEKLLEGFTIREVIIELNKQGFTTKQGKKWKNPTTVKQMVENRVYLGEGIYNSKLFGEKIVSITHEPLMTTQEYYKIKELLLSRSRNAQGLRYTKINTPLDRLIYCGCCGKRIPIFRSYTNSKGVSSWQISNCKAFYGENFDIQCKNKGISLREFLPYFYDKLEELKETLKQELQRSDLNSNYDKRLHLLEEIKRLEKLIKSKQREKENADMFLLKGTLKEEAYLNLVPAIEEEIKNLHSLLIDQQKILENTSEVNREEVIKDSLNILENIQDESVEEQNKIFRKLFDKIVLTHTEEKFHFEIHLRQY